MKKSRRRRGEQWLRALSAPLAAEDVPRRVLRALPGGRDICRERTTPIWSRASRVADPRVRRNRLSGAAAK